MKPNYSSIDIAKFLMTLLVISIHIKIIPSLPEISHFFTNGIGRIAVPFFFICSGFLFIKKNNYTNYQPLIKTLQRIFILFIAWTIIYYIYFLFTKFADLTVYEKLMKFRLFLIQPFGHLWYLPALMIGIFGTWFFHKLNLKKWGLVLALVLYCIGVLGDLYYHLAIQIPFFDFFFSKYHSFFTTTRNGIFFAFPIVYLASLKSHFKPNINLALSILFFLLMMIEYFLAIKYQYAKDYNMFFFLAPFSKFFFDWVVSQKPHISEELSLFFRKYSLGIYLIHPLWISIQPDNAGYLWVVIMSILSIFIIKKLNLSLLNKIIE